VPPTTRIHADADYDAFAINQVQHQLIITASAIP
jgi:hypothetical protein